MFSQRWELPVSMGDELRLQSWKQLIWASATTSSWLGEENASDLRPRQSLDIPPGLLSWLLNAALVRLDRGGSGATWRVHSHWPLEPECSYSSNDDTWRSDARRTGGIVSYLLHHKCIIA